MTKTEQNAIKIVNILNKAGYTALFAGGYVRDKIMKRKINDIDIATNARPNQIKEVLAKKKIRFIEIGEKFGVIAAVIPKSKKENFIYEIATFRQDFGSKDSRHPEKIKLISDPKEDAIRRDFTINGLFMVSWSYGLIANKKKRFTVKNNNEAMKQCNNEKDFKTNFSFGAVIDYVGGINDIKSKTIRFIGNPDDRINEDALRMMRAIRFACQLDFHIELSSFGALIKNKNLIKEISAERIRDEMNKILASPNRKWGIELLDQVGLLKILIPELEAGKTTPQPTNMHAEGSVWNHTLLALEKVRRDDDPILGWAALLHDIGKQYTVQTPSKDGTDRIRFSGHDSEGAKTAEKILRRFKISSNEIDKITWLVKYHMLFSNFGKMRESTRIRYLANPYFPDLLELFWIDANSSVRSTPKGRILPPDLTGYNKALKAFMAEKGKPKLPKPLLRGETVMKLMKATSGSKLVGDILREVYDAQLEKKVKTKSEAKKLAEKLLKKKDKRVE